MKIVKPKNNDDRVRRYRAIEAFLRGWPGSPYQDIENDSLRSALSLIMSGAEVYVDDYGFMRKKEASNDI